MSTQKLLVLLLLPLLLSGCASTGPLSAENILSLGGGVLQAATLNEESVRQTASLAAAEMDNKNRVAPAGNAQAVRLAGIVRGLENYDGLRLNFKAYLADEVNAFAMADGTVRVYSGLLDAMPDDEVLAVISHEIGHVALKHSYHQMREQILTDTAFSAAVSVGGVIGSLTSSQLGQLGRALIGARFSQGDELEADVYAAKALKRQGQDPYAMKRSIETLEGLNGSSGGFLSSHPSNEQRKAKIQEAIDSL